LIVDWHNFGYSMLALRLGAGHPIVRIAKRYERLFGRLADTVFCVSGAMKVVLKEEFRVGGPVVLYDRPYEFAAPLTRAERRKLAERVLGIRMPEPSVLLVSPTSWTADEPMEPLLEALELWESTGCDARLIVAISGRGPLREKFEERIAGKKWKRAEIRTIFLPSEGYRDLLRAAEMGLCFHRSSSGVDLPMKVMDLFGAGTPVCAYDYGPCLAEQVENEVTGLLFHNGSELGDILVRLFGRFPADTDLLDRLRQNVARQSGETWPEVWKRDAAPVMW
jgi:beta-1,4-mannosyltransferase